MTREKIEFIFVLALLAWTIYRYTRNKRNKYLYCIILFIGSALWWYPLFLPLEAGFTVWSALSIWIVFRDPSRKNPNSSLTMVGLILIAFGIVFLTKTLIELKILG